MSEGEEDMTCEDVHLSVSLWSTKPIKAESKRSDSMGTFSS